MDYVLGTHDEEIARLGVQHRVWRPFARAAWQRAGFTRAHTVLDVGCGPGYATFDLAEIVGSEGRVVAIDRSQRFLAALEQARHRYGFNNITTCELDLDEAELPPLAADGAWCRWVFAFVKRPREVLARVAAALRPGAALVLHEYFDYATWRTAPRSEALEEFVKVVMESWRASGGEPDIGLSLPGWLAELGFEIKSLTPLVHVVRPSDDLWLWPRSFVEVGRDRLVELGHLTRTGSETIWDDVLRVEATPGAFMVTPAVLEVVATRRG